MKKSRLTIALAALALVCFGVYSCVKAEQVSSVEVSETQIIISEGETHKLSFKVLPEGVAQTGSWRSLNSEIATVSKDGLVTGVTGGRTYVLATSGNVTTGCNVIVVAHVTGVSLNHNEYIIERDGVFQLIPEIHPSNAYNQKVTWKSSDPSVAFVGNGIVTGMAVGTADITVTTEEGGFTDVCHVEVISTVKEIRLDKENAKINKGEVLTLSATVLPEYATYKEVVWTSSDETVASVDEQGNVTGLGKGTCMITATSVQAPDVSASCEVEVFVPVTGVQMEKSALEIYVGDRAFLKAQVLPADANNQIVMWSSSAPTVAKIVAASGLLTAVKAGQATITVKTNEGGFTDVCAVTVIQGTEPVTGIEMDKTSLRLRVGGYYELFANVLPKNAANKGVTWTTSSSTVASVDSYGKVTAKDAGECIITATTQDGGFKVECKVKVVGLDSPIEDGLDDNGYIWQD